MRGRRTWRNSPVGRIDDHGRPRGFRAPVLVPVHGTGARDPAGEGSILNTLLRALLQQLIQVLTLER